MNKNRLCLLQGSAGKATAVKPETAEDFDIRNVDYCRGQDPGSIVNKIEISVYGFEKNDAEKL